MTVEIPQNITWCNTCISQFLPKCCIYIPMTVEFYQNM